MPVVKGGVWTNIEDEVLKAAVSKYGLNQWARVSSLLARKTPKQCKARWQEWLDPSIRKIEWSKEEDEKLLHLAKLMPTQWRTIAPIVGRTATQCLERYQKLLDDAETRETSELWLGGPDGGETLAPSADDVRRLRPGELDPDPESKPARPDTIDLDEDEKEMLSEARARLANTQGKKAKRKARERQLEESRRLALLQKRRELKSAGINIKISHKKKGQMDYNADIPFEKPAAPGFYDTNEELDRNDKEKEAYDPRKQQLSIKRKGEQEDDADRKRQKPDKNGPSAASQAAMKAGQAQRIREAEQNSKRRALVLPAPQVGDGELEDIIKMGLAGEQANSSAISRDNDTTRGLVGSYSNLVGQTPIRTPRAAPEENYIAAQARNLKAMTETQSSLLGGDNAEIYDVPGVNGSAGATPRRDPIFTPNPLATPFRQGGLNGTNGTGAGVGATPLRTPRDSLALNMNGTMIVGSTPRELKLQERSAKSSLRAQLSSLPRPKETDWELELPEEQQETSNTKDITEEDATARDARNAAIRKVAEAAEFKRKTQVIQRKLPLLPPTKKETLARAVPILDPSIKQAIVSEMALLIVDDHKSKTELERFDDDAIQKARAEIQQEMPSNASSTLSFSTEHIPNPVYFSIINDAIEKLAEIGMEAEKKLALHHGGYQKRAKVLRQKIVEAAQALETTRIQSQVSRTAQIAEQSAIISRLDQLREEVMVINKREREAQENYRLQKDELDSLQVVTNGLH